MGSARRKSRNRFDFERWKGDLLELTNLKDTQIRHPGESELGVEFTKWCESGGGFIRKGWPRDVSSKLTSPLARKICRFLELLICPQGDVEGTFFKVLPWHAQMIQMIVDKDEIAVSVPRSNGKTFLVAAIALAYLIGPARQRRTGIGVIGQDMDASGAILSLALEYLRVIVRSGIIVEGKTPQPEHRFSFRGGHGDLIDHVSRSRIKQISCNSKKLAGKFDPVLFICDEVSSWDEEGTGRAEKVYRLMATYLDKAKGGGRVVYVSTRSEFPDNFYNRLLEHPGPTTASMDYSALGRYDESDPEAIYDPNLIRMVNPSYDHLPQLRKGLERQVLKAKHDPEFVETFKALRLNCGGTGVNKRVQFISTEEYLRCTTNTLPPREGRVVLGVDLGLTDSMTCCAAYFIDNGRLEIYGAFGGKMSLGARGIKDGIGDAYVLMEKELTLKHHKGYMVTPVNVFVQDMLQEFEGLNIVLAVADRFLKPQYEQALQDAGARWNMEWTPLGAGMTGNAIMNWARSEWLHEKVKVNKTIMLIKAIQHCQIGSNRNGNLFLDKSTKKGRIDALQATLLATGFGKAYRENLLPGMGTGLSALYGLLGTKSRIADIWDRKVKDVVV